MKFGKKNTQVIERNNGSVNEPLHTVTPRVDIEETDTCYYLRAALPGVRREDVELQVERDRLDLNAVARTGGETAVMESRRYSRRFKLGKDINGDAVSADLEHGILTVRLEKAAQAQPRRIEIN